MTNREKYTEEILDVVLDGASLARNKFTGKIERCTKISCDYCEFRSDTDSCRNVMKKWANEEYVEKPKISKMDRTFLEYISKQYKYIAKDSNGDLYIYTEEPNKRSYGWFLREIGTQEYISFLDINFPMVKWANKEPWLIEDLKSLEVVEEYEFCE